MDYASKKAVGSICIHQIAFLIQDRLDRFGPKLLDNGIFRRVRRTTIGRYAGCEYQLLDYKELDLRRSI
jgi:hypothetical protein